MKRSPGRRPARWGSGKTICALLIAAPAIARVACGPSWGLAPAPVPGTSGEAAGDAAMWRRHAEDLALALARADADLERVRAAAPAGRFRRSLADVLTLRDPATDRGVLWLSLRDPEAVAVDAAVVSAEGLVGRVVAVLPSLALARVETTADPAFRVRFRAPDSSGEGEISGILRGSTVRDAAGFPFLEAHHLSVGEDLTPGAPVHTYGGDGVYPPDVRVGAVTGAEPGAPAGTRWVRAAVIPESVDQVEVLLDRAGNELGRLLDAGSEP